MSKKSLNYFVVMFIFSVCLIGVLCLFMGLFFFEMLFSVGWLLIGISLLTSCFIIIKNIISKKQTATVEKVFPIISFVLSFLLFAILFTMCVHANYRKYYSNKYTPLGNLNMLSSALVAYAESNQGFLPDAKSWCDELLLFDPNLSKINFQSPRDFNNCECDFAFNVNLSGRNLSNMPPDIVLLFESCGNWNLSGADNLLAKEKKFREYIKLTYTDLSIHDYWYYAKGVRDSNSYEHRPIKWR
ncbi:MAG: hypothetical protein PHP01_08880 [Phycisphaerae bacterium]|nr:hypothetical protein [Phycisphaerae bacterium]